MRRALFLLTTLIAVTAATTHQAHAEDKAAPPAPAAPPPSMTKVVAHTDFPGIDPKDPDRKPKTIYRAGDRWGRVEYPLDQRTGVHALVVVASPDGWFVDLAKGEAEHFRDAGPTYRFRAPLVDAGPGVPKALADLEFGREFAFIEATHAKRRTESTKTGTKADFYQTKLEDGVDVSISAKPDTHDVLAVVVMKGQKVLAAYRYDEYQPSLPTDPSLFAPPKGVRVVEQKTPAKPPAKH